MPTPCPLPATLPPRTCSDHTVGAVVSGQLSTDVWATVQRWFEDPPLDEVDGFVVGNAVALAESRIFSKVLVNVTGEKLAKRAAMVMEGEASKGGKRKSSAAPNSYNGGGYDDLMGEHTAKKAKLTADEQTKRERREQKAAEKAAKDQQRADKAAALLQERALKALRKLVDGGNAFESISRTDRSVLIRWYEGSAPLRPPATEESDGDLLQEWKRVLGDHDPAEDLAYWTDGDDEDEDDENEDDENDDEEACDEDEEADDDDDDDDEYDDERAVDGADDDQYDDEVVDGDGGDGGEGSGSGGDDMPIASQRPVRMRIQAAPKDPSMVTSSQVSFRGED